MSTKQQSTNGGTSGGRGARRGPPNVFLDRKRSRAGCMLQPSRRQLYQMMVRQLYHDGYVDAAEQVVQSAHIAVPHVHKGGDQLNQLVTDGLLTNMLRAREVKEFALRHRVEAYIEASALYVPLPTLRPGRLRMEQRFSSTSLGGRMAAVAFNRLGDLIACGGSGNIGARIYCRRAFEEEMLAAACTDISDTSAAVMTATAIAEARALNDHSRAVETVAFHPLGEPLLATGGSDRHVYVMDFSSPARTVVFKHEDTFAVRELAFHPSGSHLLLATDHVTPRLVTIATGQLLAPAVPVNPHTAALTGCAFSPDGRQFCTTSLDGSFAIFDAISSKVVFQKEHAHSRVPVTSCVFSRSSGTLLTGGMDSVARLWDLRMAREECASFGAPARSGYKLRAAFSATEAQVWMQDRGAFAVHAHDIYSGTLTATIVQPHAPQRCFAVAPYDAGIITGGEDGRLRMWTPTTVDLSA